MHDFYVIVSLDEQTEKQLKIRNVENRHLIKFSVEAKDARSAVALVKELLKKTNIIAEVI